MPELIPMLQQLRFSGILDSIEARNRQAIEGKVSDMDFRATIVQDEVARRHQKKIASAIRRATFRTQKTLEEFDFSFNPGINRALITDLASCRFIEEKVCCLIVGPCGTGKSHIAQALGHCAIRAGYEVLFTTASGCSPRSMPPEPPTASTANWPSWPASISSSSTTSDSNP
jgi:DNA replication protein DnaC